ncbi:MAG: GMC family oxidoreductase N-terminal domain-containing protein [Chloroflexi bacterium]|nr:GMC family oxidoreductase N-terminal domain-containing protein [Chloroflexota bacterium]
MAGGGTAGCVLAARLTEDGRRTVLLMEADPDFQGFDQLPDDLKYSNTNAAFRQGAPYDWGYPGIATPFQKEVPVPQAKVIRGL